MIDISRRSPLPLPAIAAACVVLALSGCGRGVSEQLETSEAVPVSTQLARRGPIRSIVSANGLVVPAPGAELDVVAPQSARIAELPRSVGDRVRKGDLLVRFEIPSLEAELGGREADVKRAQARLENAKAASARVQGLFDRGIAARKEVEDARRELSDAEAAAAESAGASAAARQLEERRVVRARFDGVVVARTHNPGDLVDAGTTEPILRVVDPARLGVEATVPAGDIPRLRASAVARVVGPQGFAPEEARVRTVPGAVDPTTATGTLRLDFVQPSRLPPGTPVHVEIVAEEHADALLVPAGALVREGETTLVYTVGADGKAHRTTVTAGIVSDPDAEILSGIAAGDAVVVTGQTALPDGAAVTVRK